MFRLPLFSRIMQLSDIWKKFFMKFYHSEAHVLYFYFLDMKKSLLSKRSTMIIFLYCIIGHCLWRKSRCYLRQQIWLVEFGYYSPRNGRSSASALRHASNESTIFDSTKSPSKTQIQKMEFKIQKFYRNRFGEGLSSTSIHRSASETSFCQRSA